MIRPSSRRACITLGCAAAWFFGFHVAFEAGFRESLDRWSEPEFQFRRKVAAERLAAPPVEPGRRPLLAVMFGSSRTDGGFAGGVAEARFSAALGREVRALNFGFRATRAGRSLVDFGRLVRDGIVPDFVLVEASFVRLQEGPLEETLPQHARRLSGPDRAWLTACGFPVEDPLQEGAALWRHRANALTAVAPILAIDGYGGRWRDGVRDRWGGSTTTLAAASPEYRRAALAQTLRDYRADAPQVRCGGGLMAAMKALLLECRDRNIPTAIVLMPEGPTFRGWYEPGVAEAGRSQLFALAAEAGAEVVDAWTWFDDDAFLDLHHFLPQSAETFTARVVDQAAAAWRAKSRGSAPPSGPTEEGGAPRLARRPGAESSAPR